MTRLTKVALVVGGYASAVGFAVAVTAVRGANTSGPETNAESGMYAFGDAALFCIALAAAAVPPTALGLFFLRSVPWFWTALCWLAIALSSTGAGTALFVAATDWGAAPNTPWSTWASFAFLRVLFAPVLIPSYALTTLLAPDRPTRVKLAVAAALELLACAWLALHLFVLARR